MSDQLLEEIARIRKRLERLERTATLSHSSIEDGAILGYDDVGTPTVQVGLQHDGTHAAAVLTGPVPPEPVAPTVEGFPGYMNVSWNGGLADGQITPMDFSRVEVYISDAPVTIPHPSMMYGTFETPQGGTITVGAGTGTYFVRLVTRTTSGKFSGMSPQVEVQVFGLPDSAAIDAVLAAANGKNRITYSLETPPASPALVTDGDTWFQRNTTGLILGQWRWDAAGSTWRTLTIDGQVIANLDAGQIVTGTLTADRIAAGTLTVDKLVIGSSGNQIPDPVFRNTDIQEARFQGEPWIPGFEDSGIRFFETRISAPNVYRMLYPATTTSDAVLSAISVDPGRKYRYTARIEGTSATLRAALCIDWYGPGSGGSLEWKGTTVSHAGTMPPGEELSSPVQIEWTTPEAPWPLAVPSVQIGSTSTHGTSEKIARVFGDGLSFSPMVDAEMLEDVSISGAKLKVGAVTTDKLDADAVTAEKIAADAITAEKIAANAVTAEALAADSVTAESIAANAVTAESIAANALTGKTITGGLIRSASSGRRVQIDNSDNDRIKWLSGDSGELQPGFLSVGIKQPAEGGTGKRAGQIILRPPALRNPVGDPVALTFTGDSVDGTVRAGLDVIAPAGAWLNGERILSVGAFGTATATTVGATGGAGSYQVTNSLTVVAPASNGLVLDIFAAGMTASGTPSPYTEFAIRRYPTTALTITRVVPNNLASMMVAQDTIPAGMSRSYHLLANLSAAASVPADARFVYLYINWRPA